MEVTKNHCNGSKAGSKAGSANDYIQVYIIIMLHFIIIKVFFEYFITKYGAKFLQNVIIFHVPSQPAFTCSKLTIEALEQIMKFVQS